MNLKRFYSGPRPLSALALGILVVAIPVGALPPGWWSQGNPPALSNAESNNKGVAKSTAATIKTSAKAAA